MMYPTEATPEASLFSWLYSVECVLYFFCEDLSERFIYCIYSLDRISHFAITAVILSFVVWGSLHFPRI